MVLGVTGTIVQELTVSGAFTDSIELALNTAYERTHTNQAAFKHLTGIGSDGQFSYIAYA